MRFSVLFVALVLALILATWPVGALADGHLDQEAREIGKLLKCPVCQNLSVADSPSQLAGEMRDLIRKRLEAGQARPEIMAYLVDRYGEEILLDPPKDGFSQLVWWGALAIPLGGIALVATVLRRWLAQRAAGPPAEIALSESERREYEALLERELQRSGGDRSW